MLVCGAYAAQAAQQATLIDVSPSPDSVIVVEPSEIALSFSAPIREIRIRRFMDGRLLSDDAARIDRTLATVTAGAEGEGRYLIDWQGCLLYTSPSPRDRTRSR